MLIIETPVFTKRIQNLLPDDDYRRLQTALLHRPEQGSLIPGAKGLRKLRWTLPEHGKRGGLRVLYYWDRPNEAIYMLFVYAKREEEDLTHSQIKVLARLIEEELK
jgi:hypothetical protein